jgi:hypothetical protein
VICCDAPVLSTLPHLVGRLLVALFVAGCCVVVTALPAQACSCVAATTQTHTKDAKAVFTGTVTTVTSAGQAGTGSTKQAAKVTHDVTVERVYKGNITTESVQVSTEAAGKDTCGLGELTPGRTYLFFTQGSPDGWTADRCGGTAPASDHLVNQVVRLLGDGRPAVPPEPPQAVFTNVSNGEPASLTRAAAPGLALVLVGLLGLVVVRRLGRRASS